MPDYLPTPQSFPEALDRGLTSGAASFLSPFMGLGSYLPGAPGAWFDQAKDKIQNIGDANRASLRSYYEPGITGYMKEAAANLPHFWLGLAPDTLNPFTKINAPSALATRLPQVANAVTNHGATAANALFHGARSYLDSEQLKDFFLGAGLHLGGEALESTVGGVAGNALGASAQLGLEELEQPPVNDILEYLYSKMGITK